MKFNFEEILILIVAFLIGWFSRTILQNNFIEGAMDLTQKYHNMPRERVCKDDDLLNNVKGAIRELGICVDVCVDVRYSRF